MNSRARLPVLLAIALVALYGIRAGDGLRRGWEQSKGVRGAASGWHFYAIKHLVPGTFGSDRARILWLRAEVRTGMWQMYYGIEPPEELDAILVAAHQDYAETLLLNPAPGSSWNGLAAVYEMQEESERARETLDLDRFGQDPWLLAGRPARVAVGMYRIAIEHEPTNFRYHDELADLLRELGLEQQAMGVIERAAALQPISYLHSLEPVTDEVLTAFAEGARGALGQTPFLSEGRHLTALGIVEARRRNWAQAERDLRASLELPGAGLHRAETRYHLGVALLEQSRFDEALIELELSREHANMNRVALMRIAEIHERSGADAEALGIWRKLRWVDERNLGYIFEFARVAATLERWNAVLEALNWGALIHPKDPRPLKRLVLFHIERGDSLAAVRRLGDLERLTGPTPEIESLRTRIGGDPGS